MQSIKQIKGRFSFDWQKREMANMDVAEKNQQKQDESKKNDQK